MNVSCRRPWQDAVTVVIRTLGRCDFYKNLHRTRSSIDRYGKNQDAHHRIAIFSFSLASRLLNSLTLQPSTYSIPPPPFPPCISETSSPPPWHSPRAPSRIATPVAGGTTGAPRGPSSTSRASASYTSPARTRRARSGNTVCTTLTASDGTWRWVYVVLISLNVFLFPCLTLLPLC